MFNILRSLFVIAAAVAVVGGTMAYFSANSEEIGNTITTGTLTVDIVKQNDVPLPFAITGLMPGGTAVVNFDVENTSTTGVQVRGAAFGEWVTPGLMATKISVAKVERWDGFVWDELSSADPITGIFYDSPTGADLDNYTIPAGGKSQFQVTVKLSTDAGNAYKSQVYNAAIKVQARQNGATTWPLTLDASF